MSQTSYNILMGAGFAGELVDARDSTTESCLVETSTGIAFGTGVVAGAAVNGVKVPTSTYSAGDVFRGVAAQRHKEQAYPFTASSAAYAVNDIASILRKGKIFVVTTKAVAADAAAYLDPATGNFTDSNSSTIATGGYFRSTITGAGVAELEINLP
jgi:hypothetical protein